MTGEIRWQKSSHSGGDLNQDCIELAATEGVILIRESDDPDRIIRTSHAKLRAFMLGVKDSRLDHLI
ncbi:DUF397 domain-containing protein [Streptomyces sp. UNOC14_S4]|uniref:DUF397 domain-containing protein n=1 Tax=Streptomyces sp. UNOC14_S4 TaxID=2872340 RepID=UPI001E52DDBB|nr:DUF397 domain-containing protein [Streptomyces sp. UNOC14_S4]MCC3767724.1 DUF397 domain-containing protein [Streptomyces sp. UNOC14_S4]